MSKTILQFKDYIGSVDFDLENNCLHGKILHINDLVTYEAETIADLNTAFQESVDDYLETCEMLGREPQKAFKGSLNIRIGQELHRKAAIQATLDGVSMNSFIKKALQEKIQSKEQIHRHIHEHQFRVSPDLESSIENQFEFGKVADTPMAFMTDDKLKKFIPWNIKS